MNKFCFCYISVLYAYVATISGKCHGFLRRTPYDTFYPVTDVPIPHPYLPALEQLKLSCILYISLRARRADFHGDVILRNVIPLFLQEGQDDRLQSVVCFRAVRDGNILRPASRNDRRDMNASPLRNDLQLDKLKPRFLYGSLTRSEIRNVLVWNILQYKPT